jgi:FkbM family methyltransferase
VVVAHHVGDWITHGTQTKGNYLKALASLFQDALAHDGLGTSAEGKLVLDIGGNIGLFTTIALSHGARVETFEPGTKNRKKMATTFFANGFNLVTVNPIGLGAESTPMMTYFDPASPVYNSDGVVVSGPDDPLITELRNQKEGTPAASRSCCEWYLEPVLISTLDIANTNNKLAGTYFVKIDVEGFESLVFDGGKDFFRNVHPNYVFFEVNWSLWHSRREMPHWRSVQDTVAFLEENGYEVYEAEDYFKNKRRIRPEHAVKPKNNNNPDYLAVYRG